MKRETAFLLLIVLLSIFYVVQAQEKEQRPPRPDSPPPPRPDSPPPRPHRSDGKHGRRFHEYMKNIEHNHPTHEANDEIPVLISKRAMRLEEEHAAIFPLCAFSRSQPPAASLSALPKEIKERAALSPYTIKFGSNIAASHSRILCERELTAADVEHLEDAADENAFYLLSVENHFQRVPIAWEGADSHSILLNTHLHFKILQHDGKITSVSIESVREKATEIISGSTPTAVRFTYSVEWTVDPQPHALASAPNARDSNSAPAIDDDDDDNDNDDDDDFDDRRFGPKANFFSFLVMAALIFASVRILLICCRKMKQRRNRMENNNMNNPGLEMRESPQHSSFVPRFRPYVGPLNGSSRNQPQYMPLSNSEVQADNSDSMYPAEAAHMALNQQQQQQQQAPQHQSEQSMYPSVEMASMAPTQAPVPSPAHQYSQQPQYMMPPPHAQLQYPPVHHVPIPQAMPQVWSSSGPQYAHV